MQDLIDGNRSIQCDFAKFDMVFTFAFYSTKNFVTAAAEGFFAETASFRKCHRWINNVLKC